jgi:hypothetical protein
MNEFYTLSGCYMFRLFAICRKLTTKWLQTCINKSSIKDYFIAVSFKLFGYELTEDGDQPEHVGAR